MGMSVSILTAVQIVEGNNYKNQISSSSSVGRTLHLGCRGRQFESGLFDKVVIDMFIDSITFLYD